jgi:antitoxin FitA
VAGPDDRLREAHAISQRRYRVRITQPIESRFRYDIMLISTEPIMVDILVRNVDEATAKELKKKARAAGKSVNDIARDALRAAAHPSREEIWAEADRMRAKIRARLGRDLEDSTALIRHDRDTR